MQERLQQSQSFGITLILLIIVGFAGGSVDNWAHFGGFIAGFAGGLVAFRQDLTFAPHKEKMAKAVVVTIAVVTGICVVLLFALKGRVKDIDLGC
mmetsp:Transcript_25406/g.39849  ORF Transcript_25406/g.39849 Transcript_25406/m.39849 type:complete len:95 (-) Transcript_25406:115-399(-)